MTASGRNLTAGAALAEARERYARAHPRSAAAHDAARAVMPGGNTRSVLHFDPFPLTLAQGTGAEVRDLDGNAYCDFVGEFSAGLYGHTDPRIRAAIVEALDGGIVMAAPTGTEAALAEVLSRRFPSLELLRFCNSGTEANILAIVTARAFSGRSKVMVFREAYHGGVLTFAGGGGPMNVPFEYVLADFNDADGAAELICEHGPDLAAVIVEPILGAAGNIPGEASFLKALRRQTQACGALLIFDEVKTSRCGAHGVQGLSGITPDLTTLGKYIGGGLPTGVFGGRRDIMQLYDPDNARALRHAGTFNNNVCSMAAGLAGLTEVFTEARAESFLAETEAFRCELNAGLEAQDLPMRFVGLGSMFTMHFANGPVTTPKSVPAISRTLAQLFHLECLARGVLVASRGDVFVSLAAEGRHRDRFRAAVNGFVDAHGDLVRREIEAAAA